MPHYVLSHEAAADLVAIARYTKRKWGAAQALKYRDLLSQGMEALADGKAVCTDLGQMVPGMKMMRCKHHYIFCRILSGQPPQIHAVLHEKMDLMARLLKRLNE